MNETNKNMNNKQPTDGVPLRKGGVDAHIYNIAGKKTGSIKLPESVFGVPWNDSLMHQVVTSMQDNARPTVAHTKGRGDVRGGGKKPWQQKGTGRARHGSIRSPIWKGGGVTHGPRKEKNYARAIPKKMRARALFMALSRKLHDGEILFVEPFAFSAPKTKDAMQAMLSLAGIKGFEKLATKDKNAALIALSQKNDAAIKSFRNIKRYSTVEVRNLNPVEVLKAAFIVIEDPKKTIALVESRMSGKGGSASGGKKESKSS